MMAATPNTSNEGVAASPTSASPAASNNNTTAATVSIPIRTVLNIDQSLPEDRNASTTFLTSTDPVDNNDASFSAATAPVGLLPQTYLRIAKSKDSCIRHCCPVDDIFFSAEKEFDLWYDVLETATKDLWDGENVSLLLHGPAANMSLFTLPGGEAGVSTGNSPRPSEAPAVIASPAEVSPQQQGNATVPSEDPLAVAPPPQQQQQQQPAALPKTTSKANKSSASPTSASQLAQAKGLQHNNKGKAPHQGNNNNKNSKGQSDTSTVSALEKILSALLRETTHRDVPGHYSANVAVGAYLMHPNGVLTDITPTTTTTTTTTTVVTQNILREATSNVTEQSLGTQKGSTATPMSPHGHHAHHGNSHHAPTPHHNDVIVDASGRVSQMRMFPIPSEDAIEQFSSHISAICAVQMTVANEADAGNNTSNTESSGGAMMLLSVQLHQECSISKPRTSYIRITQLINAPSVIEDVLISIARQKPLPIFASQLAKTLVERVAGSTQVVFVQSATPTTALAALPSLAAAKATVVRTELAAVAQDIVMASEMFLSTRQTLREQLKGLRDELKGLKHTYSGKEKNLAIVNSAKFDASQPAAPSIDDSTNLASMISADDSFQVGRPMGGQSTVTFPNDAAAQQQQQHRPPQGQSAQVMAYQDDDAVQQAEELLLQFQESSALEKANIEKDVEGHQTEISAHSERILALRKAIDELTKRIVTDQYDHKMCMEETRATLERELDVVRNSGGGLPVYKDDEDEVDGKGEDERTSNSANGDSLHGGGQSGASSRVMAPRALQRTSDKKGQPKRVPTPVTVGSTKANASSIIPTRMLLAPLPQREGEESTVGNRRRVLRSDRPLSPLSSPKRNIREELLTSPEYLLAEIQRKVERDRQQFESQLKEHQWKKSERVSLLEACEAHVAELKRYCTTLQSMFATVEKAARQCHSFDQKMVPNFEDVQYVDRVLITSPKRRRTAE